MVTITTYGLFTTTLPDQVSFQISLPCLPKGNGRDVRIRLVPNRARASISVLLCLFRVLSPADLSEIFLRDRARCSGRQFARVADRYSDRRGSFSSLPKVALDGEGSFPLPNDDEEALQFGVAG